MLKKLALAPAWLGLLLPLWTITPGSSETGHRDGSTGFYSRADNRNRNANKNANSQSRPAGATARCKDGTYSFSKHRRGTCLHHGGVAEWY